MVEVKVRNKVLVKLKMKGFFKVEIVLAENLNTTVD